MFDFFRYFVPNWNTTVSMLKVCVHTHTHTHEYPFSHSHVRVLHLNLYVPFNIKITSYGSLERSQWLSGLLFIFIHVRSGHWRTRTRAMLCKKKIDCSSRGPMFSFQHLHHGSQPPTSRGSDALFGLFGHHMWRTRLTCRQNSHAHGKKWNIRSPIIISSTIPPVRKRVLCEKPATSSSCASQAGIAGSDLIHCTALSGSWFQATGAFKCLCKSLLCLCVTSAKVLMLWSF